MIGRGSSRTLAIVSSVVMAAAVIAGLVVLGSPAQQRSLQLDQRRVANLHVLRTMVGSYWQQHHALPANLAAIGLPQTARQDPATHQPYGYTITGEKSYRLCAHFDLPSAPEAANQPWLGGLQYHPAGRHCIDQTVGSR